MSKILLSSDSTCDLTDELKDRYKVHCYPYHIILEGKDYLDNVTIHPEEIFQAYYDRKALPQTTAINTFEYREYFEKLFKETGCDYIIHFNLGGALSSSYSNCVAAAKEVGNVYPIDSFNLSTGTGLLVIKAAELIEKGYEVENVVREVEAMRGKVHASFILDTLKFMKAGGRCSAVTAFSASMLKIKPMILVNNADGSMGVGKKYRGHLKKVLVKYVEDTLDSYEVIDTSRIFITYSSLDDLETVELVRKAIASKYTFDEIHVTTASSTISCHCGPNTLGILFMTK